MQLRDWVAYPHQVDAKVAEWQTRFPQYLEVDVTEQYTRHKVYTLTVTDRQLPDEPKAKFLCFVPHAHEPAGTVACMNVICQLLTGKHLDGCPSTLRRADILANTVLVFVPDANPYGRSRSPEPYWEGKHFDNTEFMHLVFGIDTLYWEATKRVARWSVKDDPPAYLGIVYEPINEYEYVEPNRGDEAVSLVKIVRRLQARYTFDQVLNLHQTEFDGYVEGENCFAMLPTRQTDLSPARQAYNREWAQELTDAWRRVGGRPSPVRNGGLPGDGVHRQSPVIPWDDLQQRSPMLTIEIQNNSPQTLHEMQLLLMETAISRSIERLMSR